ncbi:hypothetical protein GCM10009562_33920 [Nocardioides aquaticus]
MPSADAAARAGRPGDALQGIDLATGAGDLGTRYDDPQRPQLVTAGHLATFRFCGHPTHEAYLVEELGPVLLHPHHLLDIRMTGEASRWAPRQPAGGGPDATAGLCRKRG